MAVKLSELQILRDCRSRAPCICRAEALACTSTCAVATNDRHTNALTKSKTWMRSTTLSRLP
jgi:hypothetical protein